MKAKHYKNKTLLDKVISLCVKVTQMQTKTVFDKYQAYSQLYRTFSGYCMLSKGNFDTAVFSKCCVLMGQFALNYEERENLCDGFEFFLSVYIPKKLINNLSKSERIF